MKHFCDISLLKKIPNILFYYWEQKKKLNEIPKWNIKDYKIQTMSRSSTILPFFEKCVFSVHNGKKFINVTINKYHFYHKLGEFSFSKVTCRHNKKKKKKKNILKKLNNILIMGNKVHPLSFRLSNSKNWNSIWFNKSNYSQFLQQDILIKIFIKEFFYLRNLSVSNVILDRSSKNDLNIFLNLISLFGYLNSKIPFNRLNKKTFKFKYKLKFTRSIYKKRSYSCIKKLTNDFLIYSNKLNFVKKNKGFYFQFIPYRLKYRLLKKKFTFINFIKKSNFSLIPFTTVPLNFKRIKLKKKIKNENLVVKNKNLILYKYIFFNKNLNNFIFNSNDKLKVYKLISLFGKKSIHSIKYKRANFIQIKKNSLKFKKKHKNVFSQSLISSFSSLKLPFSIKNERVQFNFYTFKSKFNFNYKSNSFKNSKKYLILNKKIDRFRKIILMNSINISFYKQIIFFSNVLSNLKINNKNDLIYKLLINNVKRFFFYTKRRFSSVYSRKQIVNCQNIKFKKKIFWGKYKKFSRNFISNIIFNNARLYKKTNNKKCKNKNFLFISLYLYYSTLIKKNIQLKKNRHRIWFSKWKKLKFNFKKKQKFFKNRFKKYNTLRPILIILKLNKKYFKKPIKFLFNNYYKSIQMNSLFYIFGLEVFNFALRKTHKFKSIRFRKKRYRFKSKIKFFKKLKKQKKFVNKLNKKRKNSNNKNHIKYFTKKYKKFLKYYKKEPSELFNKKIFFFTKIKKKDKKNKIFLSNSKTKKSIFWNIVDLNSILNRYSFNLFNINENKIKKLNKNKKKLFRFHYNFKNIKNNFNLFINQKYYYFLIIRYNLHYLNTVISKISGLTRSQINWKVSIGNRFNLNSQNISNYLKKSLKKKRNQNNLFNPIELIKDQLGDDLVFINKVEQLKKEILNKNLSTISRFVCSKLIYLNQFIWRLKNNFILLESNNKLNYHLVENNLLKISKINLNQQRKNTLLIENNNNIFDNVNYILKKNSNEFSKFNILKNKSIIFNNYKPLLDYLVNFFEKYNNCNNSDEKIDKSIDVNLLNIYNKQFVYLVKGFQITGFGRLGSSSRSTRSNKTLYRIGKTMKNSFNLLIDYNSDRQITRNGIYGLKIAKFYKIFNIKEFIDNNYNKYLN